MTKNKFVSKVAPAIFTALTLTSLATSMTPSFGTASDLTSGILNSFSKGGYIEAAASGGAPAPTNIINNAGVQSPTQDNTLSNNSVSVTDKLCYRSDLAVTLATLGVQEAGQALTYTATTTNNGPSKVTSASFKFEFDDSKIVDPTNFATTAGTLSSMTFSGSGATRKVEGTITGLNLTPTQIVTVTFDTSVVGSATGTIDPLVTIKPIAPETSDPICSMQDPATANNELKTFSTSITEVADLAINKTSDGTGGFFTGSNATGNVVGKLRSGSNVLYTLSLVNNGPSTAKPTITVTDAYDATQLQFISGVSAGWNCTNVVVNGNGKVTCTKPTTGILNAGTESIGITFLVIAQ